MSCLGGFCIDAERVFLANDHNVRKSSQSVYITPQSHKEKGPCGAYYPPVINDLLGMYALQQAATARSKTTADFIILIRGDDML